MLRKREYLNMSRSTLPRVLLFAAFAAGFAVVSNQSSANELIFDLVPQLAPTSAQKTLPFFRSQGFEAET